MAGGWHMFRMNPAGMRFTFDLSLMWIRDAGRFQQAVETARCGHGMGRNSSIETGMQ